MRQVGSYRLERELGRGAFGAVYVGVHVHDPELRAAVKVLHPELSGDPEFVAGLRAECRRLAALDHPGIVRFRDLAVGDDGSVAMVLELLEGGDLFGRLAEGPLPLDEAVRVLEAVLEALAHAHHRGVLHRDVKPSNVFLCADGRVKLLDFGIARAEGARTRTDQLQGTFDYMAPERFETGGSAASDVYSAGLVAFELVTGRRACPEGDLARKVGWHLAGKVPDVREIRPEAPEWLARVVSALTAPAASRPKDGAEALALLRSVRAGAPSPGGSRPGPPTGARPAAPPLTVGPTRRPASPTAPLEAPVDPPPSPRADAEAPVAPPRRLGAVILGGGALAVLALVGLGALATSGLWRPAPPPAPEPVAEPEPPPVDPAVVAREEASAAWRALEPLRAGHTPDAWFAVREWLARHGPSDPPERPEAEAWVVAYTAWRRAALPDPERVVLTRAPYAFDASFSADGQWLVELEGDGDRGFGVSTVSAAEGSKRVRRPSPARVFAVESAPDDAVVMVAGRREGPTIVRRAVGTDPAWEVVAELPGAPVFQGIEPADGGGWWVCAEDLERVLGPGRATVDLPETCVGLSAAPRVGTLLVVGREGGLYLLDRGATAVRQVATSPLADESTVLGPDGTWAAARSAGGITLWDLRADPATAKEIPLAIDLYAMAVSPDGLLLAVGDDRRKEARLLDAGTGEELARVRCARGGADQPHALVFSPDGARLYFGGPGAGGCLFPLG